MKKRLFVIVSIILLLSSVYSLFGNTTFSQGQKLSDIEYMRKYYKTIENSLNNNRKVGKIGKLTTYGALGGRFEYHCSLAGWNKVNVFMKYVDYQDEKDIIVNGTIKLAVNWSASGTMTGDITATGMETTRIVYDLKILEGTECDGKYYMYRNMAKEYVIIPWDYNVGNINRNIEVQKVNDADDAVEKE